MPSQKISELPQKTNLTGNELTVLSDQGTSKATPVSSIASLVTKQSIGLSNVNNTSDTDKPVSTAVSTALSGKSNTGHGHVIENITGLENALSSKADSNHTHSGYAPLDSPHFTGTPEVPTAPANTNNLQAANTAFVVNALSGVSVPNASTVVAGKIMLASAGDTTSTDKAVSPAILNSATSGLAASNHTHTEYAAASHSHDISGVNGLSEALADKAPATHTHTGDQIASPTKVEIVNVGTVSYNLTLNDAGKMLRYSSIGTKTLNVSIANTPNNTIFHISNRSTSGDLTIAFSGGITGNSPKNGTFVMEPGDTVSIHFVSSSVADVYGSTKAMA